MSVAARARWARERQEASDPLDNSAPTEYGEDMETTAPTTDRRNTLRSTPDRRSAYREAIVTDGAAWVDCDTCGHRTPRTTCLACEAQWTLRRPPGGLIARFEEKS